MESAEAIQPETLLFSSSDYDSDDLARLLELQRRHAELRDPAMESLVVDDDDDDFSVTAPRKKGPTVPDMRFEKQFEKSIQNLLDSGTSPMGILWSAVVKDQIIVPFISGFTWSICSNAWSWYRTKGVINAKNPKKFGFFKGVKHGVSECIKSVARNASMLMTTTTQAIEAAK
ncbi:hypothetical protein HPULCUR_012018 [Helicostylum pulchrum]|uniref:Uncharacterized protein n=1 Tax=Helicostylum pulchrum TaxID=562976 RepID=A0ABP9YHQ3_9FUNG